MLHFLTTPALPWRTGKTKKFEQKVSNNLILSGLLKKFKICRFKLCVSKYKNFVSQLNLLLIIFNSNPNNDGGGGNNDGGGIDWVGLFLCQALAWSVGLSIYFLVKRYYFLDSQPKGDAVDTNSASFRENIYNYVLSKYKSSDYPSLHFRQNPINKLPDYVDLVSAKIYKVDLGDGAARLGLKVDFNRVIEKILGDGDLYDSFQEAYGHNVVKFLIKTFEYAAKGSSEINIPGQKAVHIDDFLAFVRSLYVDDDKEFIFCMFTVQGPSQDIADFFSKTIYESNLLYIVIDPIVYILNNFFFFFLILVLFFTVKYILKKMLNDLKTIISSLF